MTAGYPRHCTPASRARHTTAGTVAFDPIDSEILRLLREDGRLSWRDLGAAVGLSANAAADRVRRLRQAGVITGFVALIDPAAGGRHSRPWSASRSSAGTTPTRSPSPSHGSSR